ncbi:polymerase [Rubrobacter tropicus]|uniref:Polymerase n=1 Tax=Rubrobacter tropicus TaxID=2653851 RepID=A0A6G8Q9P5_9ACTN|nr:O-antigen ligase family protein [Rubrobacter tropicus]QIN83163.1 polymerase [Rubrobacter tropicus]
MIGNKAIKPRAARSWSIPGKRPRPAGGRLASTAALVMVLLLGVWMGGSYGGYFVETWAPVALVLCALGIALASAGVPDARPSRWGVFALALFSGYTAWTFASILWSPNKGDAWAGAGQTSLYLVAFALAVCLDAAGASRRVVLAAWVLGTSFVAGLTLLDLASDPEGMFRRQRLIGTVGYYNAKAAFLLMPFWAAIYLSASRRAHPALRGAALGGAVLCAAVAVMAQSRGALAAMALSLPVFFLFSGARLRGLLALAPVAAVLLVLLRDLNHVYVALSDGAAPSEAVRGVPAAVWSASGAAALYGVAWGIVDLRWRPPAVRAGGRLAVACALLLLIPGALAFYERAGDPVAWTGKKLEAFKTDDRTGEAGSRYLSASGSGRYVLWEVAWRDFTEHPLLGVGTQNYEATVYRLRQEATVRARQPHALPLEILAERGAVGGVLFAGFLFACLRGGLGRRRADPDATMRAGALASTVCYWFVHSGVEWFWQMPAVTLPAIVALAMLVAPERPRRAPRAGGPPRLAIVGIALFTICAVSPLYAADAYLRQSYAAGGAGGALTAVERSAALNPLDPRTPRREAEVAARAGYDLRAEDAYRRLIRANPNHFAPYVLFGDYRLARGDRAGALDLYEKALERNPLDKGLIRSADRLRNAGPR